MSWSATSLRDVIRRNELTIKENQSAKSDCWKLFGILEESDGSEKLAKRMFVIPASSAESERHYSAFNANTTLFLPCETNYTQRPCRRYL